MTFPQPVAPILRTALAVLLLMAAGAAAAHKPSDSYLVLDLRPPAPTLRWDIALRDLDYALGLDLDQDLRLTWREVRMREAEIRQYATDRLVLAWDGACPLAPRDLLIERHSDGAYAVLDFVLGCAHSPHPLALDYRLFFDLDPQHKGLLRAHTAAGTRTAVLAADAPTVRLDVGVGSGGWRETFTQYFRLGVHHMWTGFDHMLFLVALLLPCVLERGAGGWQAARSLRGSLLDVARIVTAFTVAHSVTLALATAGVLELPARIVEPAIAASVALAAAHNLRPRLHAWRWQIAGAFGLLHGCGFAAVLGDLGLEAGSRALALGAFNLGIEAGQLLVVALFVGMVWHLRTQPFYRRIVLRVGSLATVVLALAWFGERALEVTW
ncbi:MAG: HupE/UreJ family protein [Gammaproteobacteria bacterium]